MEPMTGNGEQRNNRVAVLSDIHANLEALNAVLADAKDQECNQFLCLGDVVGYNANPSECIEIVRRMNIPCVMGNHDDIASNGESLTRINPRATATMEWTRDQLSPMDMQWLRALRHTRMVGGITLVHATLDKPRDWGYVFDHLAAGASLSYQTTQLCFHGHTHVPMAFIRDGSVRGGKFSKFRIQSGQKYFVNVGSVGEPRDGDSRAAYVIYDREEHTIELRRIKYDCRTTAAKVSAAGLPRRKCS